MITKSIRLEEAEAREFASYLQLVGGSEAALLKESALRGFREVRLARGILAYLEGAPIVDAARIAGLPRGPFLHTLGERGVAVLRGESTIGQELEAVLAAEAALVKNEASESPA